MFRLFTDPPVNIVLDLSSYADIISAKYAGADPGRRKKR
jgi:hypothetical protein